METSNDKPAPQLTGAFDLFSKSANIVRDNLTAFLVLSIPALLGALSSLGGGDRDGSELPNVGQGFSNLSSLAVGGIIGFGLLAVVLFVVIGAFINAMMVTLVTRSAQGKKPTLKELFEAAKPYWLRLFGLNLLVGLMLVIGFLLLIIPGLIVLRRYFLSSYILVDKNTSIGDAMSQSADMTKPYSGSIWGIIGVMFLLSLFGIIPVIGGLISAVLGLLYSVAPALRYEELKRVGSPAKA